MNSWDLRIHVMVELLSGKLCTCPNQEGLVPSQQWRKPASREV